MKVDQQDTPSSNAEPSSGAAHTRMRWRWLDQVMADRDLTPFAFSVAYVVASFVNQDRGEAWPSQATIAEKVGGKERGVRSSIEQLATRGHLAISTPNGRKGSNHYRMIFRETAELIEFHRHHDAGKDPVHRHGGAGLTGMAMPPILSIEPLESISPPQAAPMDSESIGTKPRKPKPKADEAGFDELWKLYPRKDAKADARKAYAAAIGKGVSHADIMAGLRRYVATVLGKEAQFIKLPAGWIRGERWADEAPTSFNTSPPTDPIAFEVRGVPVTTARALEFVLAWKAGGPWHTPWGAPPDRPGCVVPRHVLEQAGVTLAGEPGR